MAKLTDKQQRFVEEYLIDLNATQAAIRAGYSAKTANEKGSQLLTKEGIQANVSAAMAERSRRTGVNQDRVVLELAKIAFLNIGDLINLEDGSVLPTANEDDLACIESIRYRRSDSDSGSTVEREVKVGSKLKALELLGKHLGMFKDNVTVSRAIPIVITGADDLED